MLLKIAMLEELCSRGLRIASKSAAVACLLRYECPTLGVCAQLLHPAHCDVLGPTVVWPLKPEAMKFVPRPRTVKSRATWPKPGTGFDPLNNCQASLTGSFAGSAVEDGPVNTSWLIWAPDETISPGQFANTKLAASASTRKLCSLPEGNQPASETRRLTFCVTSCIPVNELRESGWLCSKACNG